MKNTYYDGQIVEKAGLRFRVNAEYDLYTAPPWEECDGHGHGIVSDWTTRAKKPGECILASDRSSHLFYDIAESIKIAKRDNWGAKTGTKGEQAARAVNADFDYLRRYCADQWHYIGVIVTQIDENDEPKNPDYSHALWGVADSDPDYCTEAANELIDQIIAEHDAELKVQYSLDHIVHAMVQHVQ